MNYTEFPYRYIVFKQTPQNFMLLAGWALQYPTALERGLYTAKMYFKKTSPTEENGQQGDITLFGVIHPINMNIYRMVKVDLYDFDTLLPMFETLEDKEYLYPNQVIGEIDIEGNYSNYFLDKYYASLTIDSSQNEIMLYEYLLNQNK